MPAMYRPRELLALAALGAAYAILAVIALAHFSLNGVVSIIWPSSGLALAALLLGGQKYSPGVFLGALLANHIAGSGWGVSACIAVGNTLEALAGWYLLSVRGGGLALDDTRDYMRLSAAAFICALFAALSGSLTLWFSGFLQGRQFPENLLRWWLGDMLGMLLLTPLLLVWRKPPQAWLVRQRLAEMLYCFGFAFLFGQAIFLDWFHEWLGPLAYGYWMFLFAAWAAVRFGRHGVLFLTAMTAVQALWGVAHHSGFFSNDLSRAGLMNLWFYLTVLTTLGMTLALTLRARRLAEQNLRVSEAHFRSITESAQALIWMSDTDKSCIWFNKVWLDFTGRDMQQEIGDGWTGNVHPEDMQRCLDTYCRHFDRRATFTMEYRLRRHDGEYRWLLDTGVPRYDSGGVFSGYIGSCFDISERKRHEQELQLAATVYQAVGEAVMVANHENRIVAVNAAFTELTGYSAQEAIGQPTSLLKSGRHDRLFYQNMWHTLKHTGRWQGEIFNRRKNGEEYLEWLMISTAYDENGDVLRRVGMFSDITERKLAEQTIWKQANFDPLTALPNRSMFHDNLKQEIRKADRNHQALGLLFIDLDRFKEINDTLGHDMGDLLLQDAAQRLCCCVRASDTVARLGGDEFTVVLSGLDEADSIERIAANILASLAEPFQLGSELVYVSASIGITLYPTDADCSETLIKNADQAMYAAKNQGRNGYHFFTASMQQAAQARMRLAGDLRGALAGGQLQLYYQPIMQLAGGGVQKAEALLRWLHPERGMVSPAEFIPIAEDTGMIVEIGDWVFRQAAGQALLWRDGRRPQFQISVNKSPVQFRANDDRSREWLQYLGQRGLAGQGMVVEITEGLLLNPHASVIDVLLRYREAGLEIALDDFGTGYSSLSYLKKFPIDYLKIDQSFVRSLGTDSKDMAMCEAIIVMAHKLGLKVIAEGVEQPQHHELLLAAGCDYGQGYYYGKPMPAEEFERFLAQPP